MAGKKPASARAAKAPKAPRVEPNDATRKLDLDAALRHLRRSHPRMAAVIRAHDRPVLKRARDPFRELARAIIYQQLSGKAAGTICARFEALFEGPGFPKPNQVIDAPLESLRACGLSKQKASYLIDLSTKYASGEIEHQRFSRLADERISEELLKVKGIGQWSADMFLIFALNRPDVLPVGDLGVRKGMQVYFDLEALPKPSEMIALAEAWRPFRSIGSWYMWRVAEAGLPE